MGRRDGLNALLKRGRNALIGIDHQHVIAGGAGLRALALDTVALPVGVDIDLYACRTRHFYRVIGAAGIKQDDFIRP